MPTLYGLDWGKNANPVKVEMEMIRNGGYITVAGVTCGHGLSFHYEQMRKFLWPRLDDHRWHRLCRDEILKNKVTVLLGPGSSGKTHEAAWIYLVEYFCWPNETCVLVSSTDLRGLRLRVWGEITMLWQEAIERYKFLPGHLLESRIAITTDEMTDGDYSDRVVRDMRKGIIGIPTVQSGKFVGLGKWIGIKQKRVRLIADEAAAMGSTFLSAFANLNKNEDFRAIIIGNPSDPMDPLGKAAEPLDGWSGHLEPKKTEVWKTRFMGGTCVNLIGTDSPNFDFPDTEPTRYKYLISKKKIEETLSFFPKDSFEYYSQCVGCMKVGTLDDRIVTRELCRNFGALDPVIWKGSGATKVCALDAAYGGDRAVCGHVEFGEDVSGRTVIAFSPPQIIPVTTGAAKTPEEQLAVWVRDYCERNDIPPANFFHDSTGRGGLGTAIASVWSAECNPVEFGGAPTERPVSTGLYTYDMETQTRRLVTCKEHYDRLVSELHYQVRYTIMSSQFRSLPEEVMDELCMRKWDRTRRNNKISVETKEKMKERMGRSPDLADWCALCLEGARRLGFIIEKLPDDGGQSQRDDNYLENELRRYRDSVRKRQLHYT